MINDKNDKINLAVIFGGKSREHEVSLSSALEVIKNLNKNKYNIIPIAITKKGKWLMGDKGGQYLESGIKNIKENNLPINKYSLCLKSNNGQNTEVINCFDSEIIKKIDLVFPILHGPFGEDGKLQGMLDLLDIPYIFSNTLAHAIAMDKSKSKIFAKHIGLNTPKEIIIKKNQKINFEKILKKVSINFPLIVKPINQGSSIGIEIVKKKQNLTKAINNAFKFNDEIIIEQYIKGREFTVTILENPHAKPLGVTEIIPLISDFYDFKAKYRKFGSKHICPAKITKKIEDNMKNMAVKIFKFLNCHDLARVDLILDENNDKIYFIEINTIPGMTPTSLAPEAAKQAGYSFDKFLETIINNAIKRNV